MWQEGGFRVTGSRRFSPVIYPVNKLLDILELRHLLISKHGYRLSELDDMPMYEIEMTSLIAVQTDKNEMQRMG